uniref:Uncharacterized protein n=1 Tax=Opuntia streptacantha TaxID=393608 RepID=A0A7C9F270_OPUST
MPILLQMFNQLGSTTIRKKMMTILGVLVSCKSYLIFLMVFLPRLIKWELVQKLCRVITMPRELVGGNWLRIFMLTPWRLTGTSFLLNQTWQISNLRWPNHPLMLWCISHNFSSSLLPYNLERCQPLQVATLPILRHPRHNQISPECVGHQSFMKPLSMLSISLVVVKKPLQRVS